MQKTTLAAVRYQGEKKGGNLDRCACSHGTSQSSARDFIISTHSSKVAGLVINEIAPAFMEKEMSFSSLEVVKITIGMCWKAGSALISRRASRPSFRGMLRSSKIRLGNPPVSDREHF